MSTASVRSFGKQEIRNLTKVIESGNFAHHSGGFIDKFEKEFAEDFGAKHAIAGATAMLLMHAIPGAIGAGAGDEIICDPVVQFHGIAGLHGNVVPVWADIRKDNFLLDPKAVEKKITKRTKGIWVTHLWGFPAEADKLRRIADKHGIYLIEDCAHAMFLDYKGKYVGNWGHIGTFSFNMGKHLGTGEGGMAITNDDSLNHELRKRIIFGESPPVLASNYRMTEFSAAVGVVQLKKVPRYLEEYRKGKLHLDKVVDECSWLGKRALPKGAGISPYQYACIFRGDKKGYSARALMNALQACGGEGNYRFGLGFTQRPAYQYDFFRAPRAYGDKGCPYNCHLYKGKVDMSDGLCPVAEDVIPRLVTTGNMVRASVMKKKASILKRAIQMVEAGKAPHDTYSDVQLAVLDIVQSLQPVGPASVTKELAKKGTELSSAAVLEAMEALRSGFPRKLSHAGPERFAYHDLTQD
ncbi:MAG: DegT/DnrJ/EryC1/StrS family aminotransferase [Planctomycetota bacterium]|jgi:dTDP-4-amino-4,6-dideoxygalactose transaminase|nr:DegT/DnrJ/EryC1/StrS family aminotransferase [Planctomycetota bacterium]